MCKPLIPITRSRALAAFIPWNVMPHQRQSHWLFLNLSIQSSSHIEEMKFSITSFLEDESNLQNRWWIFDDEVLEESDMTNNESVFTLKLIMNQKNEEKWWRFIRDYLKLAETKRSLENLMIYLMILFKQWYVDKFARVISKNCYSMVLLYNVY